MTSKIVVNNIESDTGVSTVTIASPVALSGGITGTGFAVGTGASISSPATNILTVSTNNAERIRVGAAGSIGIGTDNPATQLHVNGGLFRVDSSGYGGIILGNNSSKSFHITKEVSDNSFNVWSGVYGAGTNRFKIDSSGRVTKPYQPAFFASSSASSVSTSGIVAYNSVAYNIGSHYDGTTNYRFTAPVSGIYHIGFMLRANNSNTVSGYGQLMLNVNGSASTSGRYLAQSIYGTGVLNSQYASMCANTQLSLSAGDYVDIRNTNTAINFSGNESYFYGILLG